MTVECVKGKGHGRVQATVRWKGTGYCDMEGHRLLCDDGVECAHGQTNCQHTGHVCLTGDASLKIIPTPHLKNGNNT